MQPVAVAFNLKSCFLWGGKLHFYPPDPPFEKPLKPVVVAYIGTF